MADSAHPTALMTLPMLPGRTAGLLCCLWLLLIGMPVAADAGREPAGAAADDAPAAPAGPVLLVSIDGFHPRYLERGHTPRLQALAEAGVQAVMRPSFPTMTFPNHYTLVTGQRPDNHGVLDNYMRDPALGRFRLSDPAAATDGRWYDDAEPLWVTARRAGLGTATLFWPGSEAEIRGLRPHDWLPFDESLSPHARVRQVLDWLARPPASRPDFITLYFDTVDSAGHDFGPDSAELDAALVEVDRALGELLDGLQRLGLADTIHLVIVSDHGMARVAPNGVVLIDELIDPSKVEIVKLGETSMLAPKAGHEAEVEAALLGRHERFECWRREALPARWRFGQHRRVPPLICVADEGFKLQTRAGLARRNGRVNPGAHGYAPEAPSMQALFVAHGPSIPPQVELAPFDNVEVYPLLARLLGVEPAAHDATGQVADALLGPARR